MSILRTSAYTALFLSMVVFFATPAAAQETSDSEPQEESSGDVSEDSSPAGFGLGVGIGVQTFPNPDYDGGDAPKTYTYQSLRLAPDIRLGKFGMGLDLTLNYSFSGDHNTSEGFAVRQEDWVPDPDEGRGIADLYLPKIRYISWGQPSDSLYVALGNLSGASLGNGFIVGGYSNALFFPDRRFFGMQLNLDGSLVDFPVIGVQTFSGNLARFDVMGGRIFARPLVYTGIPLLTNTQLGVTAAVDRDPYFIARTDPDSGYYGDNPDIEPDNDATAAVWGFDIRQPVLNNPAISLAVFADAVSQNDSPGAMLGTGGRLFRFLPFSAQIRFMGEGFQPVYFNRTYDLYRIEQYQVYSGEVERPAYTGWLAQTGLVLVDGALAFNAQISGPFSVDAEQGLLPEMEASLTLGEGLVPGLSADAFYEKRHIANIADVIDPIDAVIGARINYRTGPAVISLLYDLRYDPYSESDSPWKINSGLETTLTLF